MSSRKRHKNRSGGNRGHNRNQGHGHNQGQGQGQGGNGPSSPDNGGRKAPRVDMVLPDFGEGYLEISDKGFGFLRTPEAHFHPKPADVFVTPDTIKRCFLREGCLVKCTLQPPHRGTSPQCKEVLEVNRMVFQDYTNSMRFENLTTIDPIEKFRLETAPELIESRLIDLVTPIGKGTRGLIVAPPRTGKTTILKQIANAVTTNHPDVHVLVLLIDERPEEVTDFQRSVQAEVVASSNDQDLETHVRLSRFMVERCRRMVEAGKDVLVLLDSITRVARAYNSVHGGSGRTMTGGVDARALEIPRKIFAAARKTEEAGSLTIVATALVDTGSRMDELIFQEFKGTGNMELVLDRKLSDRRLFPALDIPKSGTRKEEKLFPADQIEAIRKLRRMMVDLNPVEAMETLQNALRKYKTNAELLSKLI
ncbi:MAG: transcription termination factor Rho [Verrucomicrobiales bacterium]|nr:transcription termination factor Rho [Verrucomicrobiales bacterium]